MAKVKIVLEKSELIYVPAPDNYIPIPTHRLHHKVFGDGSITSVASDGNSDYNVFVNFGQKLGIKHLKWSPLVEDEENQIVQICAEDIAQQSKPQQGTPTKAKRPVSRVITEEDDSPTSGNPSSKDGRFDAVLADASRYFAEHYQETAEEYVQLVEALLKKKNSKDAEWVRKRLMLILEHGRSVLTGNLNDYFSTALRLVDVDQDFAKLQFAITKLAARQ